MRMKPVAVVRTLTILGTTLIVGSAFALGILSCAAEQYSLKPLHMDTAGDRKDHVRALVRDLMLGGEPSELDFAGAKLGRAGIESLCSYLSLWVGLDAATVAKTSSSALEQLRTVEALTQMDLCVGLLFSCELLHRLRHKREGKILGLSLGDVRVVSCALRDELLLRRDAGGLWGTWRDTAWSFAALQSYHDACGGDQVIAAIAIPELENQDPGETNSEICRVYQSCAIAIGFRPWAPVPKARLMQIEALLPEVSVDDDLGSESALAYALAWIAVGPSSSAEHPIAPAKKSLRNSYEAGRVVPRGLTERAEYVLALEWLGYDDFGARLGYLPAWRGAE